MPLKKIPLQSGFNKQFTASQAEGQWIDGDNVRFRYGSPEKIGGWQQITNNLLVGVARNQYCWSDLTGRRYSAIGTDKCLYVFDGSLIYDITPLNFDNATVNCTLTSTTGSNIVNVYAPGHGVNIGDIVVFGNVNFSNDNNISVSSTLMQSLFGYLGDNNDINVVANALNLNSTTNVVSITNTNSLTLTSNRLKINQGIIASPGSLTKQVTGSYVTSAVRNVTTQIVTSTSYTSTIFQQYPFQVTSVVDLINFTITMPTIETGTGLTVNGVDTIPYYIVGPALATLNYGFGAGLWGDSTWGTPRASSTVNITPGNWSLDNFGEDLIATIRNGQTFIWYPDGGQGISARAQLVSGTPTSSTMTIVSDRDRHLFHLGTEVVIGDPTTVDPMYLRWSDTENITVYEATSTNTAGDFRLDDGTRIVGAVRAKEYILVLTDTAAYQIQFTGAPYTFSITKVGSNCGAIGQHSMVFVNGAVWWMGINGSFFTFNGTVVNVPSLVQDFVFTTIGAGNTGVNFTAGDIICAGLNVLYNEITWFYPTAVSNQINRSVTYNYNEQVWSTGSLARTTWFDSGVFPNPLATKYDASLTPTAGGLIGATATGASYFFAQEVGKNEILYVDGTTQTVTNAISSYIQSGDFDLTDSTEGGDGQYFIKVRRFIPDFKNLTGTAQVQIFLKPYPADLDSSQGLVVLGPYDITSSTNKIDVRGRGRLASIQISNNNVDDNWRYGIFRVDMQQDSRR